MTVRQALLALLDEQPMSGAQLRAQFERRTAGSWPLNVGQVYQTLARLERDGLVEAAGPPGKHGHGDYRLTGAGRAAAASWWTSPVDRAQTPRDELVIKLALAVTEPEVDLSALVQAQRQQTVRRLRQLTRLRQTAQQRAAADGDLAGRVVLDHLVFAAVAEVRLLDEVAARAATGDAEAVRGQPST